MREGNGRKGGRGKGKRKGKRKKGRRGKCKRIVPANKNLRLHP